MALKLSGIKQTLIMVTNSVGQESEQSTEGSLISVCLESPVAAQKLKGLKISTCLVHSYVLTLGWEDWSRLNSNSCVSSSIFISVYSLQMISSPWWLPVSQTSDMVAQVSKF